MERCVNIIQQTWIVNVQSKNAKIVMIQALLWVYNPAAETIWTLLKEARVTQILGRRSKSIVPVSPHRGENDWLQQEGWGRFHRAGSIWAGLWGLERAQKASWYKEKDIRSLGAKNPSSVAPVPALAPEACRHLLHRCGPGHVPSSVAVAVDRKEQQSLLADLTVDSADFICRCTGRLRMYETLPWILVCMF